jgi:hypothetical protein
MALKVTQLYNSNFFSQVGSEYICTGYMFDDHLRMESVELQLEKASVFMANQVIIDPVTLEVLTDKKAADAAKAVSEKSTGGASAIGAPSMAGTDTGGSY